ncbi:MAG: AraC family transcriptional regulator [Lachnospiraceae bacterium]|nr:AraC family transcriptional regulator [Lachnospiraceae bacterium]
MKFNVSYNKIVTDENLMETIQHGDNSYPFHFYYENLAMFDFNCIEWHWHTELEFLYVESGTVTVWIGEKQFTLSEGSGIFINSRILHRFYSPVEAIIPNFLCMPSFIAPQDSLIFQKYVLPIISSSITFQIFHVGVAWQAEALSIMKQIIAAQNSVLSNELMTASLVQRFWLEIYENVDISYEKDCQNNLSSSEARLQLMMQYIHLNYLRNISLDEIATHAMASKSTALNLFRKYLHVTPVKYLINYRLKEAAILLSKTEKKVNTISDETGFNNVEYFCRIFKKHYHLTPSEYRNEKQWKSYDR